MDSADILRRDIFDLENVYVTFQPHLLIKLKKRPERNYGQGEYYRR